MTTPIRHISDRNCHCMICRADRANKTRIARTNRRNGIPNQVPITKAVDHLNYLRSLGMGHKAVAKVAGLAPTTTSRLMFPGARPVRQIHRETEAAILAVRFDLDQITDKAKVLAVGTHRRVQALIAIGWSLSKLSEHLGIHQSNFEVLSREYVLAKNARAVRDMYNDLWDKPPVVETRFQQASYTRTLNWAKAQGFVPPQAWDDDTIDDPAAEPDMGSGKRRVGVPYEELVHLRDFGWSEARIASRFKVSEAQVRTRLKEAA